MTKTERLERLIRVRQMLATGEAEARRVAAGLSFSEMSEPCKVDGSTVWRWEKGLRTPRGETALRYLRVLDMIDAAEPTPPPEAPIGPSPKRSPA